MSKITELEPVGTVFIWGLRNRNPKVQENEANNSKKYN
jgi:hypothetical protein